MTMQPTVMVVDDEVMVATALQGFLELDTPYRVLTFTAPAAALEALADEPVDVIVSDFMMPGMDGITFLREARQARPMTARILLTGYADKQNAIRAINEAGLYYYLEKPWDNEHLKLVIRNGIERTALFNELDARVSALEDANRELYGIRRKLIQAFL
ncbi:MAG TPA: response regulator [Longimicrobiales bacterium]|nr:response regulator [Longimicrobiales bacterium]